MTECKRQRRLARGGYVVSSSTRAAIAAQYPEYPVDWAQIDRALAAGPPGAQPLSPQQLSWLEVEGQLREWAETPSVLGREAQTLRDAAETLPICAYKSPAEIGHEKQANTPGKAEGLRFDVRC
ncbi:MAG: hypothetical protein OWR62_15825 [Sulfobacillus thermotolerans]|nr:hypothetical protein [Sulfobacillus thermotolerans]